MRMNYSEGESILLSWNHENEYRTSLLLLQFEIRLNVLILTGTTFKGVCLVFSLHFEEGNSRSNCHPSLPLFDVFPQL